MTTKGQPGDEGNKGHLYLKGEYLPASCHTSGWPTNTHGRGDRLYDGKDRLCSSTELTARLSTHP